MAVVLPYCEQRTNGSGKDLQTNGATQLVELKNGVTFNGHLVDCDNFMNVTLREVYQTSADGDRFWKMKEMFVKGNMVSELFSSQSHSWGGKANMLLT